MATEEGKRVPQLIAFDLDYTIWGLYIDTYANGPLKRKGCIVQDKYGEPIEFFPDVPEILNQLRSYKNTKVAACSRTHTPDLAREALSLIQIPSDDGTPKAAVEFFDEMEIYPGSKLTHFKELHRKTGIPYTEMLFYDDEWRNCEVEKLGVTFVLVQSGLDTKTFENGLDEWRKRPAADV